MVLYFRFYILRDHVVQFYNQLYSEQFTLRPKLDGLSFNSIGVEDVMWLERAFEVVRALYDDKAPGFDGFSMAFFQIG
jgi:hypothetical protein